MELLAVVVVALGPWVALAMVIRAAIAAEVVIGPARLLRVLEDRRDELPAAETLTPLPMPAPFSPSPARARVPRRRTSEDDETSLIRGDE